MFRMSYCAALLALCAMPVVVQADIYKFTDEQGVVHYSNVPNDPRFRLYAHDRSGVSAAVLRAPQTAGSWRQRAAQYERLINLSAAGNALQPALLRAVIVVESAFNARAVSRAGAKGLMQLLPGTARRYGVDDPFDAAQNVDAGAHYLHDLLTRYHNNLELALAAYNAGEEAVDRHGGQIPPYRETREYVPEVLRWYHQFQAPVAGG